MTFTAALERLVENKIQAAMEEGAFDNLSGHGKPLDLTAYFATPEEARVGYALLKSADCTPAGSGLAAGTRHLAGGAHVGDG